MTSGNQPINSGAPVPVQGVTGGPGINQGTASVDPGTGALVFHPAPANVVQIRGSTPGAFQVFEFSNSTTNFSRLGINAATGGPFVIDTETGTTSPVVRDLVVRASGTLFLEAGNAPQWSINNAGSLVPVSATQALGSPTDPVGNLFTQNLFFEVAANATVVGPTNAIIFVNNIQTLQNMVLLDTGTLALPRTPAFVAGDHYVTMDVGGHIHISTLGPAA